MSGKYNRGDRVEINGLFAKRLIERYGYHTIALNTINVPFWVALHGFINERADLPFEGMLGTVLGYQHWKGSQLCRVNIADTKVYLFDEDLLNLL